MPGIPARRGRSCPLDTGGNPGRLSLGGNGKSFVNQSWPATGPSGDGSLLMAWRLPVAMGRALRSAPIEGVRSSVARAAVVMAVVVITAVAVAVAAVIVAALAVSIPIADGDSSAPARTVVVAIAIAAAGRGTPCRGVAGGTGGFV